MEVRYLVPRTKRRSAAEAENPIATVQREINSLFDSFFPVQEDHPLFGSFGVSPNEDRSWDALTPRVDISETDKQLSVSVELPGMGEEDIEVSIKDNMLSVTGEKCQESKSDHRGWHRVERHYGSINRSIPLPCQVDENKADASFKNGVLTVSLPKTACTEKIVNRIPVRKG